MYNNFTFENQRIRNGNYNTTKQKLFTIEKNPKRASRLNQSTTKYFLNKNERVFITASDNIEKKMSSIIEESKNSRIFYF